jgi:hypothetical protein
MTTQRTFRLATLTLAASFALANALAAQSAHWDNADYALPANSKTTLRLVFIDCSPDDKKFKPPAVPGLQFGTLRISETITETTTGNTRHLYYDFTVNIAANAGTTLTIPAFDIKADEEQLSIPAATFAVVAGTTGAKPAGAKAASAPTSAPAAATEPTPAPAPATETIAPTTPAADTPAAPTADAPATAPSATEPPAPVEPVPTSTPATEPAIVPPFAPSAESTPSSSAAVHGDKSSPVDGVHAALAAILAAAIALAIGFFFRHRRRARAAAARSEHLLKTLRLIGLELRTNGKKLHALLFEWKRDAATFLNLDLATLDERKLPNARWYALWQEATNVIEKRTPTLTPTWLPKATEAVFQK